MAHTQTQIHQGIRQKTLGRWLNGQSTCHTGLNSDPVIPLLEVKKGDSLSKVANWTNKISEFWLQVRNPTSVFEVERLTLDFTLCPLRRHMHPHTYTVYLQIAYRSIGKCMLDVCVYLYMYT